MGAYKSLIGIRFGELLVVRRSENNKYKRAAFVCQCNCGVIKSIASTLLVKGLTKSCGTCLGERYVKSHYGAYRVWRGMVTRTTNKNQKGFVDYGGRGIIVCDRWLVFENFYADMGDKPTGKSLDRIENDKGYYKENCRWATPKEQANNTRKNKILEYGGLKMTIRQWEDYCGFKINVISQRIHYRKWSIEKAITTPVRNISK